MTKDNLIRRYIELRDQRAARKRAYEVADEADKAEQESIENEFMRYFSAMGIQSAQSEEATVYISERKIPRVNDLEAFKEFVINNSAFDLPEYRCNKSATLKFALANGNPPPGVEVITTRVISLRRGIAWQSPDTDKN